MEDSSDTWDIGRPLPRKRNQWTPLNKDPRRFDTSTNVTDNPSRENVQAEASQSAPSLTHPPPIEKKSSYSLMSVDMGYVCIDDEPIFQSLCSMRRSVNEIVSSEDEVEPLEWGEYWPPKGNSSVESPSEEKEETLWDMMTSPVGIACGVGAVLVGGFCLYKCWPF